MAITVRLIFDIEDSDFDDTDKAAAQIGKRAEKAVLSALKGSKASVVGVSRLTTGLMRGNQTVDAVEGQAWSRVEL